MAKEKVTVSKDTITEDDYLGPVQEEDTTSNQDDKNNNKNNKKRSRIPTSCSVCRKKKVKCDKKKPTCSSCLRAEFAHLCEYEEPSWVNDGENHSKRSKHPDVVNQMGDNLPLEVKLAFQKLINKVHELHSQGNGSNFPYVDEILVGQQTFRNLPGPSYPVIDVKDFDQDEKVDIFDYLPVLMKKGRLEHNGPFSAASLIRCDRYSKVIWLSIWKRLEAKNTETHGNFIKDPIANEVVTNNRFFTGFIDLRKRKVKDKQTSLELRVSMKSLEQKILEILPDKRNIMTLLVRFFRVLYPYFPIINENIFFVDLNKIIETSLNKTKIDKLLLDHDKEALAVVGILLIILRLSYISLTAEELEDSRLATLKQTPVDSPVIQLAKECLANYQFLRKSYGLRVVQLTLFLSLYYRHSPEDDYVSDQSGGHITLGLLFSMGYSIGIHRNPYIFTELDLNENGIQRKKEMAQVCRKLWHKLIEMDCNQSVFSGEHLNCVDDRSYDIPLPIEDEIDDKVDSWVAKDYKLLEEKNQLYRMFSAKMLNIHNSPSVIDILRLIQMLEIFSENKIEKPNVILNQELPHYGKVKKLSYFIEIRVLLLTLNNQLLTHFEKKGNSKQSFTYLVQILQHCTEIHETLINVLFNENLYFGLNEKGHHTQEFSFFIKPLASMALAKSLIILGGVNARFNHTKQSLEKSSSANNGNGNTKLQEKLSLIEELISKTYSVIDSISGVLTRLSCGNYNLCRNLIAVKLFLKELRDFDFINPDFQISKKTGSKTKNSTTSTLFKHFYDLNIGIIPKDNYTMLLITPELQHLVQVLSIDVLSILKPIYTPLQSTNQPHQQSVFFDPVNELTRCLNTDTINGNDPAYSLVPSKQQYEDQDQVTITQNDLNNFFLFSSNPLQQNGIEITGNNNSNNIQWPSGQTGKQFVTSLRGMDPESSVDGIQDLDQILTTDDYSFLFGGLNDHI